MYKQLLISFGVVLAILLVGCDTPTTSTKPPAPVAVDVPFKLSHNFVFGTSQADQAIPTKVWLAGTFNSWNANDDSFAMTTDPKGDFVYTYQALPGTVLKFKYIVQTSKLPAGQWWTDMQQVYGISPLGLAPAKADVTFENDGFQGFNAVFTVK